MSCATCAKYISKLNYQKSQLWKIQLLKASLLESSIFVFHSREYWTTAPLQSFWEPSRTDFRFYKEDNTPYPEQIRHGFKQLKVEFKLWKEEWIEKLRNDPKFYLPGDTEIVWKFDSKELVNKWIITTDKLNDIGNSECQFVCNKDNKGLFTGFLDPKPKKGGKFQRSGYCNIQTPRVVKSFHRDAYLDWTMFTHLIMRVRGDGRSYMLNIGTSGTFDINWHDTFSFTLFTRGGPYWQTAKIPFSRFYFTSKGRVQDKQEPLRRSSISAFGITIADGFPGSFQLEIDYIGIYFDGNWKEDFAYEMYEIPKYIVY